MAERRERKGDDLAQRLIALAVRIGNVVDALPDVRLGRHVAGQLIRCGTAAAPNYAEARGAESRRAFVHKLGVCLKELRESQCWLTLVVSSKLLPERRLTPLLDECDQLTAIIVKSIATARKGKGPTGETQPGITE